jgi:uncharacterized membrane protein
METQERSPEPGRERDLDARAVDRLVFFADAVIAIIITLMVLEVRLPTLAEHASEAEVLRALIALWPKYLAVVLSFLVIGLFWTLHHRRFNRVRRVDSALVWLDLSWCWRACRSQPRSPPSTPAAPLPSSMLAYWRWRP